MIRRIVFWTTFAFVLAVGTVARAAESLRIVPITSDDSVVVSVELSDAYNDDIRQAIASGLRTQFTYDIELRMVVPAWIDRTVASAIVNISDQYDNLTRRHTLSRLVDGRVQETITTDDDAVVRQWLTTLTRLPICETSKLDPNRDYYVRIIARSRPGQSILGLTNSVTGQVRFTFIP